MQFSTLRIINPPRLLLIVLLACSLAGCGQKGPLQRPDQVNATAATNASHTDTASVN